MRRLLKKIILLASLSVLGAITRAEDSVVLLPSGWNRSDPLPVVIWLHGYGANPTRIRDDKHYQFSINKLGIALVGIPATRKIGEASFVWADDVASDHEHIIRALAEVERKFHVTFTRKALYGFSQGAVVVAELAARYPDEFAGAMILSPGADLVPRPIAGSEKNRSQRYFISVGAEEHPGNLKFAQDYRAILKGTGAIVSYRAVPDMTVHNRPPDWAERFPEWTKIILGL